MSTIICYIVFVYLTIRSIILLYTTSMQLRSPLNKGDKIVCNGPELFLIFIFTTGLMGILPLLSIRLAILEILCLMALSNIKDRPVFTFPVILFIIFIIWTIIGLSYTKSIIYGIRMILKYIYPLLVLLLASSIVREGELFIKSLINARWTALAALIVTSIPILFAILGSTFWNSAAIGTHCITLAMFSLGLFFFSKNKKSNLIWFVILCLPCFVRVLRTDIMGTMIALCTFFIIKYKIKAIPFILVFAILSLASIFYIPSVKEKMFFNPDTVTISDFFNNSIDENNINMSGRKAGWEQCKQTFYDSSKIIGSGTGRVQTFFYEEAIGWQRGGQLHNDFLVLLCDNGLIGLVLYIFIYIAALIHCIHIYHINNNSSIKLAAIVAGSSLIGVIVTMFSDNTISYSMATLSYPWGIYGMTLGLLHNKKNI